MDSFPKNIHQIWIQGESYIPDKFKSNINEVKTHHPDWTYHLWDDVKIIQLLRTIQNTESNKLIYSPNKKDNTSNETLIDVYYKMDYLHQKIDFARYVILYVYGGVYVDMDAKCIQSMNKIVSDYNDYDIVVSKLNLNKLEHYILSGKKYSINNGIILAKPNSESLYRLIKDILNDYRCEGLSRGFKMGCINSTTGPRRFTESLYEQKRVKILDCEYFEPCVLDDCNITSNTYFIHHHERTWIPSSWNKLIDIYTHMNLLSLSLVCFVWEE